MIGGPGDEPLLTALRDELPAAAFAPATTLRELADLLGRLDLLVGTDSGVRHLAAVHRVPTVTLFGPTDPRGWNPPHPDHVALVHPAACAPCNLTRCPVAGHPCLDELPPERVLAAVRDLWQRRRTENR